MIARAEFKDNGVFQALKQWKKDATKEVKDATTEALKKFEKDFVLRRLQRREKDSLGTRTRELKRSLKRQVKTKRGNVWGRVYFRGEKAQMIARTHQYGATIKPKDPGGYLVFKIFKKYSRGKWKAPPKKRIWSRSTRKWKSWTPTERWVSVKQVNIPARLNFFQDWDDYHPYAMKILLNARDRAVAKGRTMFS